MASLAISVLAVAADATPEPVGNPVNTGVVRVGDVENTTFVLAVPVVPVAAFR